jgi:hypothetical protein
MLVKFCSKCYWGKPLCCYDKNKEKKDGLNFWCKECASKYNKQRYQNNKEKLKEQNTQWRLKNPDYNKQWHLENPDYNKQWHLENPDYNSQYGQTHKKEINLYFEIRKQGDLNFKIACNLRSRLCRIVKNGQKAGSAVRDLGCSVDFFKAYIESKFYPHPITGEIMSWENYGRLWQFDHMYPLSKADLTDRIQFLWVCHYTNIQPLWKEENLKKGNKIL